MKVLLVANTLPPTDLSGVGEQVLQLSRGLITRGHEVRILGRGPEGARGPKLLFPLAIIVPFIRELRRFRPEVVQVHESDGAFAALALKTLGSSVEVEPLLVALLQVSYWQEFLAVRAIRYEARVLGRPGWRELRFRWFKAPLQIILGCLTAWLADRVLAPSETTARELRRDYGAAQVSVVSNATAPPPPAPRAFSGVKVASGTDSRPMALFVGRLRVRKGVEVALHAMSALDAEDFEARLVVAGEGEHRTRLEGVVEQLGLHKRVEFLGRKSRDQVRTLMESATVLVVPSLYEGMPLVIVEAMQCGLAVVASAVSGIPEVVADGQTGWLVPCEDPVALAGALKEALGNPGEARSRGEAGRERLELLFAPENAALAWEDAIEVSNKSEQERKSERTLNR